MIRVRAREIVVTIVIDSNEYILSLLKIDDENIRETIYIAKKYDGNIKSTKITDI